MPSLRMTLFAAHHRVLHYSLAIILVASIIGMVGTIAIYNGATMKKARGGLKEAMRREEDRVTNLTGQPPVKFQHYSGYVGLGPDQKQKFLFYWFFEAEEDATGKPLVLWLNGGSGCSSIAVGAVQEIGPFLVRNNGTQLVYNKYSWNKAANILFVEAPVGVGFSYTTKPGDIEKVGDAVTASDSLTFILNWLKRFPAFRSNPFYIVGESYAGHYVPQLAEVIYRRNKEGGKDSHINLKGVMIGNAVINELTDLIGLVDYAWSRGVISDRLRASLNKCHREQESQTRECAADYNKFINACIEINLYNFLIMTDIFKPDPKQKWESDLFFNRRDIQKALHANTTELPYPYSQCSIIIKRWSDSPKSVLPVISRLLEAGLRIWIYSGDNDGRVPLTATRYSVNRLGLRVIEEWRSWWDLGEVAGWVETYEGGLMLATVRGAGHQVPVFAPQQALVLFQHFLAAEPLPTGPPPIV